MRLRGVHVQRSGHLPRVRDRRGDGLPRGGGAVRAGERGLRERRTPPGAVRRRGRREHRSQGLHRDFYHKVCSGHLPPVLDTLEWVAASDTWPEVTTSHPRVQRPGRRAERRRRRGTPSTSAWTSLHFSAFHPDYKMRDVPPTPPETTRARRECAAHHQVRLHRQCPRPRRRHHPPAPGAARP